MEVRVWDCPSCGAPLPPAGLDSEVTCAACGKSTTLGDGSDAILREKQSRTEAEALFARLGQPPSWSQRVAKALVAWPIWVFGFPFALGILWSIGEKPRDWLQAIWERLFHERLVHVAPQVVAWLVQSSFPILIAFALLVWSLLGERVDARRDLQAMLAAKPPETDGGPSRCRKCSAPLDLAKGALGTRCPYCGADNLVVLPADWIAKAREMSSELRLTTKLAAERARVGRRRMLIGAAWRVPLVALMVWYITRGAQNSHSYASWNQMRVALHDDTKPLGLYAIAGAERGDRLRTYTTCTNGHVIKDPPFDTQTSHGCDELGCEAFAMFALERGEKFHITRVSPGRVAVRLALAPRFAFASAPIQQEEGDEVLNAELPDTELVQPIEISGWYQLRLFAKDKAAAVAITPCVDEP